MAYTTVPTYTTNQLITSAHANTYWRDNINQLWPFTTIGDMAYASAADTLARIAVGAAGQRIGITSGLPAWRYGAPLIDYDITKISSEWTSTDAQAFQDSTFTLSLTLPVISIVFAVAHMSVLSIGSSGNNIIYRMMIDSEGGETHTGQYTTRSPGSCAHIKECAAGTVTCVVQAYGYLTNTCKLDDGEIIAYAFPRY